MTWCAEFPYLPPRPTEARCSSGLLLVIKYLWTAGRFRIRPELLEYYLKVPSPPVPVSPVPNRTGEPLLSGESAGSARSSPLVARLPHWREAFQNCHAFDSYRKGKHVNSNDKSDNIWSQFLITLKWADHIRGIHGNTDTEQKTCHLRWAFHSHQESDSTAPSAGRLQELQIYKCLETCMSTQVLPELFLIYLYYLM